MFILSPFCKGLLVLLLILASQSTVSLQNIRKFFSITYDTNNDGHASFDQFMAFFTKMQPEHNLQAKHIDQIFRTFDTDSNSKVTLSELIELTKIKISVNKDRHRQIHLGLTNNQAEMQVMWVSTPQSYDKPVVQFGRLPNQLKHRVDAQWTTYNVGHIGFHGRIYRAVMKNLDPLKRYYYRVGDSKTQTFSETKYFKSPPLKAQELDQVTIAIFGDMGTFTPFGYFVMQQIARDSFIKPFDFVFLTGDIAYAGVSSEKKGEIQTVWDLFGELSQIFAAYSAFMPGVGNHEKYYNYTSYKQRYVLPRQFPEQTNLWFSFDYGQVHMVHFSSEHPYQLGSQQYDYLENDLRKARQNPHIKWIILGVHRAFYSSDSVQYAPITNLAHHLEDLVNKYKVDLVQTGHLHDYERTWPTYKGKALKEGCNQTHFINPKAPVYVVQGNAGALIRQKFIEPRPQWSLKRFQRYGYGRIIIKGNQLKYQSITIPSGRVADEWRIIKQ